MNLLTVIAIMGGHIWRFGLSGFFSFVQTIEGLGLIHYVLIDVKLLLKIAPLSPMVVLFCMGGVSDQGWKPFFHLQSAFCGILASIVFFHSSILFGYLLFIHNE